MSESGPPPPPGNGVAEELAMLERVFFRIASANSDEELTEMIQKYLPPVILKLSSSREGVRKKILEMLVHVNKRIKSNDNILLPMDALLVQYQDPSAVSFVTNFTIIYIKMGFPRLPPAKAAELVPAILKSLDGKPEPQQDALLMMILPVLGEVTPPSEDPAVQQVYLGLSERPVISKLFKQFLLDYLLLPYGAHPSIKSTEPISSRVPAGLSENSWKRVSGETPVKAEDLERGKTNVVKFLGKYLLPEMDIALHLIVAMADTRHSVANEADTIMRKLSGHIDWNDPVLIGKIYALFLGTFVAKDKEKNKLNPKPEFRRVPANTRLRLKLMPHLLKSREAAIQFPACVQVTFDLLFGTAGNSNAKLRTMAIGFIHHLIDQCPDQQVTAIGPVLMSALRRLIEKGASSDVPVPAAGNGATAADPHEDEAAAPETRQAIANLAKLRASSYIAIGKLGRRLPRLVNSDISVMQTFFEAMSQEDKETQLSLQESLSLMAPAFKKMDATNLSFVEAMLATHIESEDSQVRLVSVQYAGEVFPPHHVVSRYILLLGAGDVSDDIRRAASSKLYGPLSKAREKSKLMHINKMEVEDEKPLPDFVQMLVLVLDKANIRMRTQQKAIIGSHVLAFQPKKYEEILNFLRICLMQSAGVHLPERDELNYPQSSAPKVAKYLETLSQDPRNVVVKFADFAEKFLTASSGLAQTQCLLHLMGCAPYISKNYSGRLTWLKGFLNNTREDIRENVAGLYACVAANLEWDNFSKAIADLQKGLKEKTVEFQHGLVVTIGYSFGRKVLLSKDQVLGSQGFWPTFSEALKLIVGFLSHHQPLLASAACLAIGEMGRSGPLTQSGGEPDELRDKVVAELLRLMKSEKVSMKVRERAALSCGLICVGDVAFPDRKKIIQNFLDSAQDIKDVELHLTMGEALVHASFGPLSSAARDYWTTPEEDFVASVDPLFSNDLMEWILKELVEKHTTSLKPDVRQASCLWLLALVKHGMKSAMIRSKLLDIQAAFMNLLSDGNEIIQDAASKGVGLVYECSSEEQKQELVNILLATLGGKPNVTKVTEDTKVFEEGQLGKAPGGENLSTYKELCSLASDINPELVYQFMHLANNNAIWQSRLGGAFGFSSIAAKAGEQLEPYLPKILPKLYRYQFDPVTKIQVSMTSIWNALVQDNTKTVDLYLPHIMDELQKNLTNNQWRVREACCGGLQEIVRGRSLDTVLDRLPDVWRDLFRVMDDIKESVRLAAAKTVAALSRACIKMCDVTQSPKSGEAAVRAILPTLIDKGLGSDVSDVRAAALVVIMKISRSAGELLKPHLGVLIPALLVATGEMEGKELNYYSTRLANDASIQERLDSARIAAARSSPMMDCVNFVLQYVDSQALTSLASQLIDLIKQPGIALGTKGATVHVITTLTHQCPLDLQQYTGKILAAFVFGLSDRNAAVRKMYALSIGHLLKTAKDSSVEKLFAKMKTWYMEKDDDASRMAVALTFQAISRHNPDKMKSHAADAMPIAFLAMHEEKTENSGEIIAVWEEVWSEGTSGTEGGLRMFLREIIPLLTTAIESPMWRMKALAAKAMATVATKLGDSLPRLDQKTLLAFLINALGGRTWNGKEFILLALRDVVSSSPNNIKTLLSTDENLKEELLVDQLIKECLKEKKSYRMVALASTGQILRDLELDYFTCLYDVLRPVVTSASAKRDDPDMTLDVDLEFAVIECLSNAWPANLETQKKHLVEILSFLSETVENTTRKNQINIATSIGVIISRLQIDPIFDEDYEVIFSKVGKILATLLAVPKSSQLRLKSVEVTAQVLDVFKGCDRPEILYLFKNEVSQSIDDVIKDLGCEVAAKDKARDLKAAMADIVDNSPAVAEEGVADNDVIMG